MACEAGKQGHSESHLLRRSKLPAGVTGWGYIAWAIATDTTAGPCPESSFFLGSNSCAMQAGISPAPQLTQPECPSCLGRLGQSCRMRSRSWSWAVSGPHPLRQRLQPAHWPAPDLRGKGQRFKPAAVLGLSWPGQKNAGGLPPWVRSGQGALLPHIWSIHSIMRSTSSQGSSCYVAAQSISRCHAAAQGPEHIGRGLIPRRCFARPLLHQVSMHQRLRDHERQAWTDKCQSLNPVSWQFYCLTGACMRPGTAVVSDAMAGCTRVALRLPHRSLGGQRAW